MFSPDYNTGKGAMGAGKVGAGEGGFFWREKQVFPCFTNVGAPTNGTSGTLFGFAPKGALLLDTTNATVYQNTGTLASPTWTLFSLTSGSGAFTGNFDGIIGANTPAAATVTTLAASGAITATGGLNGAIGAATPADGKFTTIEASGIVSLGSVNNAVSAAGTTRADATALTKQINHITTAASGTGVILPASVVGQVIFVFNDGANPAKVYGAGSDTVDTIAGATGVTLTNAKRAMFICVAANNYVSAQLGVVSG